MVISDLGQPITKAETKAAARNGLAVPSIAGMEPHRPREGNSRVGPSPDDARRGFLAAASRGTAREPPPPASATMHCHAPAGSPIAVNQMLSMATIDADFDWVM